MVRAVLVSVGYAKELSLCLPRNAPHFESVTVATTPEDADTLAVIASMPNARPHVTRDFYAAGARFNKGLVLEQMLREITPGWFCVLDADVALPASFAWPELTPGKLYTPLRRMCPDVPDAVPPDSEWYRYPHHRYQAEHAGYFQLAHTSDPVLRSRPWYPTDWKHAGGCDSFFQMKWRPADKVRPPFDVLHFGESAANWMGRSPDARAALAALWHRRRANRAAGRDPFDGERLPG